MRIYCKLDLATSYRRQATSYAASFSPADNDPTLPCAAAGDVGACAMASVVCPARSATADDLSSAVASAL